MSLATAVHNTAHTSLLGTHTNKDVGIPFSSSYTRQPGKA